MKKNIVLLIFSLFFSLFLIEIILIFKGTYVSLTKNKLVPSAALYERPSSSFQKVKHPDLNYLTSNYFDENGVKNYSNIPTNNFPASSFMYKLLSKSLIVGKIFGRLSIGSVII